MSSAQNAKGSPSKEELREAKAHVLAHITGTLMEELLPSESAAAIRLRERRNKQLQETGGFQATLDDLEKAQQTKQQRLHTAERKALHSKRRRRENIPIHSGVELPDSFAIAHVNWLEKIFEYLYVSRTEGWHIPTTVVYSRTRTTLFTSDDKGRVERVDRRREQLPDAIIETMLQSAADRNKQNVVAYFVSNPEDDLDDTDGKPPTLSVKYLDADGLRHFVKLGNKGKGGILQEFIPPPGPFHATIRVWHTPHHTQVEQRQSKLKWEDRRIPVQDRASTFESREFDVITSKIVGKSRERLHRECLRLIHEVNPLLPSGYKFTSVVLHFKMVGQNQLALLFCSGAKTAQIDKIMSSESSSVSTDQLSFAAPVALDKPTTKYNTDDTPAQSTCPSCHRPEVPTFHVSVGSVLRMFLRLGVQGGARRLLGSNSNSDDLFNFGDPSLDGRGVKEDKYIRGHPAAAGDGIARLDTWEAAPFRILKNVDPLLSLDDFNKRKTQQSFLDSSIPVCESCCLTYNTSALESLEAKTAFGKKNPRKPSVPPHSSGPNSAPGGRRGANVKGSKPLLPTLQFPVRKADESDSDEEASSKFHSHRGSKATPRKSLTQRLAPLKPGKSNMQYGSSYILPKMRNMGGFPAGHKAPRQMIGLKLDDNISANGSVSARKKSNRRRHAPGGLGSLSAR